MSHEKDWAGAQKWHRTSDSIVPGALRGLSKLIFFLGASKVFLISFAKKDGRNGGMRKKIKDWLHKEICICAKTGLLKNNIIYTDNKTGSRGKGLIAVKHGITHFIDDSLPVLQSIYDHTLASTEKEPKALFHFPRSGRLHKEIWADEKQNAQLACFKQVYNWTDVLDSMDLAGLETKEHIPEHI